MLIEARTYLIAVRTRGKMLRLRLKQSRQTRKEMKGNCYVTSEALYHLLGGKKAGWMPMCISMKPDNHWFLKHSSGMILDATATQFKHLPDYSKARGIGFLTKQPSKRAQMLMKTLVWQNTVSVV